MLQNETYFTNIDKISFLHHTKLLLSVIIDFINFHTVTHSKSVEKIKY